jgi:hypothetical protein
MKIDRINYNRIAQAQSFYKGRGYQNVEAPWLVTPQAVRATLPLGKTMMETVRGVLVNSGEQAFIQLMMNGHMEAGIFQTTTSCYQDTTDHQSPYYFGVDETSPWSHQIALISYKPDDVRVAYQQMVNDVMACFFEISDAEAFNAQQNDDGVDLHLNGIIVATFGVRKMNDHVWVYGSGLIEPRFTTALHSIFGAVVEQPVEVVEQSVELDQTATATEALPQIDSNVLRFPSPPEETDATV